MQTPPRWPLWLLQKIVKRDYLEEIQGNLEERFQDNVRTFGPASARRKFIWDTLSMINPVLLKNWDGERSLNRYGVLRLYLRSAGRTLIKNKVYSIINLLGLTVGMGICLVIFQYIHLELSYDQFHKDHDQIYRAIIEETNSNDKESYPDGIGYGFAPAALKEIPEIIDYVRKGRINRTATVTNPESKAVFYEDVNKVLFADVSFFDLFDFPMLSGDKSTVFRDNYSIVITEKTARKYFGDQDPIGKGLRISGPPSPGEYTVTAVLKDIPLNTHWQFDFLIPIKNYIAYGWGGAVKRNGDWNGFNVINYFKVEPSADIAGLENKLNVLIASHRKEEAIQKQVVLQPLKEVYLKSNHLAYQGHFNTTGNVQDILIFGLISAIVLLIAWLNYINLSITQSIQRAKEVGIRKTMGATRSQLVTQFISESLLLNAFSAVLAIGLAHLLLPLLGGFLDKELEMSLIRMPEFWISFVLFIGLGAVVSGVYPAFVLSAYRPITALKAEVGQNRMSFFRKALMVFQFLISFLLITATYLVYQQVSFMRSQELNVDMERILVLKGPRVVQNAERGIENFRIFRTEMAKHANVEAVSGSLFSPGDFWASSYRKVGAPPGETAYSRGFYTTLNFENTYGLEFLAGGSFTGQMPDEKSIIINEEAVKAFGFESPQQAVNTKLVGESNKREEKIVGVVKNFHWHSLREGHEPYVISLYENRLTENISVRLNTSDISNTLADLRSGFEKFFPGNPFDYYFADAAFNEQYRSEKKFSQLFFFFSILAIFIGCIGLFALVSYNAELRAKEIGIRKVLGAKVNAILILLSKQYFWLFGMAIVLGTPMVWVFGGNWLSNYATRISLGFQVFLIPSFLILLIGCLTIAQRTIRTANINPVDALRNE